MIQGIIFIFIGVAIIWGSFLYFPFLLAIFANRAKSVSFPKVNQEKDIACIITAYRNVEITIPLVTSLLRQRYQNFHIYLVADNCGFDPYPIEHDRLTVIHPQSALNLKIRSIIHAIQQFIRPHEYIAIFDADNLAHPEFLMEINRFANQGFQHIQGRRTAKNLDSVYACADATGEFFKNYVERYATYRLGASAVISGSGMAIEADWYKAYLESPEIQIGHQAGRQMLQEDKILQNFLLKRNQRIAYAWDAVVYDEKVSDGKAVETQRSRWLYSYFQNLPNTLTILSNGIRFRTWNQFLFGLVTLSPPLFIQIGGAFALLLVSIVLQQYMLGFFLLTGTLLFFASIPLTLYLSDAPKQVWKTLWGLPLFAIRQVFALLKMRNPNKNFQPTKHGQQVSVDEVLIYEKQ